MAPWSAGATDPHHSPTTADALKHALRSGGLLDRLVAATVESVGACRPHGAGASADDAAHTRRYHLVTCISSVELVKGAVQKQCRYSAVTYSLPPISRCL